MKKIFLLLGFLTVLFIVPFNAYGQSRVSITVYRAQKLYSVNEFVTHNGTIYRANAPTSSTPPSASWDIYPTGGGGVVNLTDLADVTVTGAGGGQFLRHNGSLFVNTTIGEADILDLTHYVHPTTDGNLHVPVTGTINNGKVLTAGATAGTFTWENPVTGVTDHTLLSNIGTNNHPTIDAHIAETNIHYQQSAISITESQISDLLHTVDTNTQLDEAAVDAFVANNGYSVGEHTVPFLEDVNDVIFTSLLTNDIIQYDGANWRNIAFNLYDYYRKDTVAVFTDTVKFNQITRYTVPETVDWIGDEITTKDYVNKYYQGISTNAILGETVAAGEIVYKSTDGKYYKASNQTENEVNQKLYLAKASGVLDDTVLVVDWTIKNCGGCSYTIGLPVYLSETAGGMTDVKPTTGFIRIVGFNYTANYQWFNPLDINYVSVDGTNVNGTTIASGPTTLAGLTDTEDLATVLLDEVLYYNGTKWENIDPSLLTLVGDPYNATNWNAALQPATKDDVRDKIESLVLGSTTLDGLTDVVSATNTNRFALMANGTTGYVGRALVELDISDLSHFVPSTLLADYSFTDNSTDWNNAFSWGDHSLVGYNDVSTFSEKAGALVGTDRLVGLSGTTDFNETISGIPLSIFNNDSGWTANVGDALTSGALSQFAATTSAQLAGVISNETGTGFLVFDNDPTFSNDINVTGRVTAGTEVETDDIIENTPTNGVSIDGVLLKDGLVDGVDVTAETFSVAASDLTTSITTGTNKAYFRMPYAATLTNVRASLLTPGTTTGITIDIHESGTSILHATNKLKTDATEGTTVTYSGTPVNIIDSALADDAVITINFDAIPTGGAGVIVTFYWTKN
jgi:hypothetical protein